MRMWWQGMVMVLGGAMVRDEAYLTLGAGAGAEEVTETRDAGARAGAGAAAGMEWVYFSLTTTSSRSG
jgi:hypothetical protein